ncbi:hypothetical protein FB645_000806 [Coemansia sp. IMI 203386]|nr:hypothetical protein FB645_000806 [Coemansia sp. IMI 203386]
MDTQAPVQAYAKLEGPDFCYYIRSLEVTLGRHPSSGGPTDKIDIDLGDSKAVSRRHARILYNFMNQSFELQVLGKNGCLVDDEYYARGQNVMLRHRMVIQIGDTEFAFLLPKAAVPAETTPIHAQMPGLVADPVASRVLQAADGAPQLQQQQQQPIQQQQQQHPAAHPAYAVNAITPQRLTLYAPPDAARHTPSHLAPRHRHPPAPLVFAESPMADQQPIRQPSPVSPLQQQQYHAPYEAHEQQQPTPAAAAAATPEIQEQPHSPTSHSVPIRPASDKPVVDEYAVDPNTLAKPTYSYASLIAQAINATKDKKVTLSGIYSFIMQHYPYYRHVQNGWQNSIRHNLSLNKAFVRVQRASNEPGKGSYWAIEDSYKAQFSNGVYKRTRRTKKDMEMERERQRTRARVRQESRTKKNDAGRSSATTDRRPIAPAPVRSRRSSNVGHKRLSPGQDSEPDQDDDDDDDEDDDVDPEDEDNDVGMLGEDHHSPNAAAGRGRRVHPAKKRAALADVGAADALSTGEDTVDYMSSNMGSAPASPASHHAQMSSLPQSQRSSANGSTSPYDRATPLRDQQGPPANGTRSRTGSIAGRHAAAAQYPNPGSSATTLPSSSRPSQPRPQRSTAH